MPMHLDLLYLIFKNQTNCFNKMGTGPPARTDLTEPVPNLPNTVKIKYNKKVRKFFRLGKDHIWQII